MRIIVERRNGDRHQILVDDDDRALVEGCRWFVLARPNATFYAATLVDGRIRRMHQIIMGLNDVDHINHDGLDNRRENLRPATRSQQNGNQRVRAGGTSRFKGVTWNRATGKWRARIGQQSLGHFLTEREAAEAYDTAAFERWGDYATLNL